MRQLHVPTSWQLISLFCYVPHMAFCEEDNTGHDPDVMINGEEEPEADLVELA